MDGNVRWAPKILDLSFHRHLRFYIQNSISFDQITFDLFYDIQAIYDFLLIGKAFEDLTLELHNTLHKLISNALQRAEVTTKENSLLRWATVGNMTLIQELQKSEGWFFWKLSGLSIHIQNQLWTQTLQLLIVAVGLHRILLCTKTLTRFWKRWVYRCLNCFPEKAQKLWWKRLLNPRLSISWITNYNRQYHNNNGQ